MLAPTEEEDQVAVVPNETVDKATENTAEARLEERMAATMSIWAECQCGGGLGRGYSAGRGERSSRGNREDRGERRGSGDQLLRGQRKKWSKGTGEAGEVWSRGSRYPGATESLRVSRETRGLRSGGSVRVGMIQSGNNRERGRSNRGVSTGSEVSSS